MEDNNNSHKDINKGDVSHSENENQIEKPPGEPVTGKPQQVPKNYSGNMRYMGNRNRKVNLKDKHSENYSNQKTEKIVQKTKI